MIIFPGRLVNLGCWFKKTGSPFLRGPCQELGVGMDYLAIFAALN